MNTHETAISVDDGYSYAKAFPEADARKRPHLEALCAMLKWGWDIGHVATTRGGTVIVNAGFSQGYDWWVIGDNGGELSVQRVNDPMLPVSVPYEVNMLCVAMGDLAAWVAATIRGEAFDVADRCCAELEVPLYRRGGTMTDDTTPCDELTHEAQRLGLYDPPFVRRCEDCGKPCTYPLGAAGYCLRCMIERQHHNPGLYGRPTTKGTR